MKRLLTLGVVLLVSSVGCYHATVDTGRTPSTMVVSQPFASAWIYGLVPPKTVELAQKCPNGVARVETQLSFVNQLVGFITFGIYTPMSITVTCAEAGMTDAAPAIDFVVPEGAGAEEIRTALALAAEDALREGRPTYVWLP